MKKIIKAIGIMDAIALVAAGLMYFLFDFKLTPLLPVLLAVLIFCMAMENKS